MTEPTSQALAALSHAGWYPGRSVIVSHALTELRCEGHTVTAAADAFLREFLDLKVAVHHAPSGMTIDSFVFSALGASSTPAVNVALYETRVDAQLTPVGLAFGEVMTLMLSASGIMYAAVDATLLKVGEDPIGAINALCENRELEEIRGVRWGL